jgi:hypothetical protein
MMRKIRSKEMMTSAANFVTKKYATVQKNGQEIEFLPAASTKDSPKRLEERPNHSLIEKKPFTRQPKFDAVH